MTILGLLNRIRKFQVLGRHNVLTDEASAEQLNKCLRAWRTLKRSRGYLRSLTEGQCVDVEGDPIPWYTYPAIEQLAKWDFSQADVLEYGCGNSTIWWSTRAHSVTSIESDPEWFERIKSQLPSNCSIALHPIEKGPNLSEQTRRYVGAIDQLGKFDVIVIDGVPNDRMRLECTKRALSHLLPGGMIIVDNSDWLPLSCREIRDAGLFEIDFCGLSPLNDYAGATSMFFTPEFHPKPRSPIHPGFVLGGYEWDWETTPKPW